MELHGASAILTGASGGIGAALARQLLAAGCDVLAVGRDGRRLQALVAPADAPAQLTPVLADIADERGRAAVMRAAAAARRRPNLLIHAAAVAEFGLFADLPMAQAERLLAINVLAPMALTQAALPMLSQCPPAQVVAIGSTFGSIGYPGFAAYSASKFALRGLFEALAREHADGSVRFSWLAPRATRTPLNSPAVQALNAELGTAVDEPEAVARQLIAALREQAPRRQLGWPEKLFARLNGAWPELVDRALRAQLPAIRRHAQRRSSRTDAPSLVQEIAP